MTGHAYLGVGLSQVSTRSVLWLTGTRLPFIQYLVSLALVEAIESQTAPLLGLPVGSGATSCQMQ